MSKLKERSAFVYILVNPINEKIFYVGSTRGNLSSALYRHCSPIGRRGANLRKIAVVKSILKTGQRPVIKSVETCPVDQQFEREKYWRLKLSEEHPLTNACGVI
jgi:hypothetical protein